MKIYRSTQIQLGRVIDRVAGLDIQGDGLARQRLHEDLHATTPAQHQVKGTLLLDVVIRESSTVLQLFACEDQSLLVGRDALLVLAGFSTL